MKTILFRLLQFIFFSGALSLCFYTAQAQTAKWIRQGGTGGIANGVSADAAKNTYATGIVSNPAVFDNLSVPCFASDIFLAKYNADGIIQWVKTAGGELLDQGNEIVTDASGNSYVVGATQTNGVFPTVTFESTTLTGHGSYDWFIAKYNADGILQWVKNEGSTQGDFAFGATLDPSGNVIVCGEFSSTMTVGGTTLTSAGLADVFVAKYDANGNLQWIKRAGGTGNDEALSVVSDASGNIAVAGNFQNTATFGTNSVTASGLGDAFITKYDASGNNLWVKKGGGTISFATDRAHSISVDASDNFYVTGEYSGTATFDNLSIPQTGTSGTDIFIAKYDNSGTIQWLHHAGGTHDDKGYSIGADQNGNTFVSGFADSGPGVVFDTISLPPIGNQYIFLAKYNSSGDVLYVKQYAAGNGQDIHVLNDGCLYFSGGASKSNSGNEFDTIDLVYADRGAFIGEFCEPVNAPCLAPSSFLVKNITSSSAKVTWGAVVGATSYTIQFRKQGSNNWKTKTTLVPSKKLMNLQPSTTYEFHVATVCANGTSPYSTLQTFTTAPLKESAPIIKEISVSTYPNPSQNKFTLTLNGFAGPISIHVFDINGKIIYSEHFEVNNDNNREEIALPESFKGLAYVRVSDGINNLSQMHIVE